MNATIDYYNQNAKEYIRRTFSHDMGKDHDRFLRYIPPKGKILDAGCGSGRDAFLFQQLGYQVEAIDAAEEMVKQTSSLGISARRMLFCEIDQVHVYDAIWCSASLLHIPSVELPQIVEKMIRALKKEGIFFVSFKKGSEEKIENGRHFHFVNEETLLSFFSSLKLLEMWTAQSAVNLVPTTWLKAIFLV